MNLVDRAKNIIMTPKTEWHVISAETPNIGQIITGYVLPLALIPAIAHMIGWGLIGVIAPSMSYGIASGLISIVIEIVAVYVMAYLVNFLAPNLSSQKDLGKSFQLVAYSFTPSWVAGVLYVVPSLGWLAGLAGLYSLYLLYLGLPVMMKTPQDKVVLFLIVCIITAFIVYMVVGAILNSIFFTVLGIGSLSTGGWY